MNPKVSIIIPTKDRERDLINLLNSINSSSYTNYEIILINNSLNKLSRHFYNFPKVSRVIENKNNLGLSKARNQGVALSQGKYVLFIDDDNILHRNCISELVSTLLNNIKYIACGPVTYYLDNKDKVWFISNKYNFYSSLFTYNDDLQKIDLIDKIYALTDTLHNCFMVNKELVNMKEWFDEKIYMSGTEFDFFLRLKKKDFNYLVTNIKAISYHNVPSNLENNILRRHGVSNTDSFRIYYIQRNRAVIIKRYGNFLNQFSLFFLYPFFMIYYFFIAAVGGNLNLINGIFKGTLDGYKYLLFEVI